MTRVRLTWAALAIALVAIVGLSMVASAGAEPRTTGCGTITDRLSTGALDYLWVGAKSTTTTCALARSAAHDWQRRMERGSDPSRIVGYDSTGRRYWFHITTMNVTPCWTGVFVGRHGLRMTLTSTKECKYPKA